MWLKISSEKIPCQGVCKYGLGGKMKPGPSIPSVGRFLFRRAIALRAGRIIPSSIAQATHSLDNCVAVYESPDRALPARTES
jgi:hypothetical protein